MKSEIRNKIILHGKFFDSFLKLANKEGYATPEVIGGNQHEIERAEYVDFYGIPSKKNEVLQMLLIFDEVSFINPIMQYDLSKLQNTGLIKVFSDDRSLGYLNYDTIEKDLLLLIKPIIIDRLKGVFKKLYSELELKKKKISYSNFLSVLYDYHIINNHEILNPSLQETVIIEMYLSHIENQISKRKDAIFAREKKVDEHTIGLMVSATYMGYIQAEIGTLLCLLDMSNTKNGVLMQNDYKFDKIISSTKLADFKEGKPIIESYKILKLSYQKFISNLPALGNINDVLKLKEKKHKEIKQLQQVLHEIEIDLRSGRVETIKKVDLRVKKVVKDLNRNLTLQKVTNWLTYMSVPITTIETILSLPPVMGFSTGIAGLGATLKSNMTENKNGWLQVIR